MRVSCHAILPYSMHDMLLRACFCFAVPFLQADSPEGVASIAAVCLLLARLHQAPHMTTVTLTMIDPAKLYLQLLRTRGTIMTIQHAMLWSKLLKSVRDLAQVCKDSGCLLLVNNDYLGTANLLYGNDKLRVLLCS
jgi:hypothetical protein